jgi:hypothetical protein
MGNDTVISFSDPALRDELSELVRQGAQRIIRQAVEAELQVFLDAHGVERDEQGRRAVVRNGYLPEREILTGIGTVPVRMPKTRGRRALLSLGAAAAVPEEDAAARGGDSVAVPEGGVDQRL